VEKLTLQQGQVGLEGHDRSEGVASDLST
jgi:hypothetical protein